MVKKKTLEDISIYDSEQENYNRYIEDKQDSTDIPSDYFNLSVFLIKNMHAAPSVVPTNGISIPSKIFINITFSFLV